MKIQFLEYIARALGLLAIVQGSEYLWLRRRLNVVWPSSWAVPIDIVRVLVGLGLLSSPHVSEIWILLILHLWTLRRFAGLPNGGSDAMNLLLLWTTALGLSFSDGDMPMVVLYYITLQLCLSYFKAGFIKLRRAEWRSGRAALAFVNSSQYEARRLLFAPRAQSWGIILFEISFPLALLHPKIALTYMTIGALFHLGNAYVFGLNRFFFAWLAAYPALYYCSTF